MRQGNFGPDDMNVGSRPDRLRATSRYAEVRRLHAAFHAAASDALGLALAGMQAAALAAVAPGGRFANLSTDLIQALREWQSEMP